MLHSSVIGGCFELKWLPVLSFQLQGEHKQTVCNDPDDLLHTVTRMRYSLIEQSLVAKAAVL